MAEKKWLVIRCPACNMCFGHRSLSGRCPHCGQRVTDSAEVLCTANSSSQLRIEVALANTPEDLRGALREKLSKNELLFDQQDTPSPNVLIEMIRRRSDETHSVGRITVNSVLAEYHAEMEADGLMERAEQEGLVRRIADGRWQFLE